MLFSIMVAQINIPVNSVGGFPSFHTLFGIIIFNDDLSDWCEVIAH